MASQYMRNKIGFRARTGQTLFFSLLLGCVFYNLGRDASGLQDRQGLLFFVNINMFFTGIELDFVHLLGCQPIHLAEECQNQLKVISDIYAAIMAWLACIPCLSLK